MVEDEEEGGDGVGARICGDEKGSGELG